MYIVKIEQFESATATTKCAVDQPTLFQCSIFFYIHSVLPSESLSVQSFERRKGGGSICMSISPYGESNTHSRDARQSIKGAKMRTVL